jgi:excisionase family DNA binding protein
MAQLTNFPDVLTITEVAKILRVSNITIKRWGKKNQIYFFRVNKRGDRRFLKSDIINLINKSYGILNK